MTTKQLIEELRTFDNRGMSEFQMTYFALGRTGITKWGTFVQSCTELSSRVNTIRLAQIELDLKRIDLEEVDLELSAKSPKGSPKERRFIPRRNELKRQRILCEIEEAEFSLQNEINNFINAFRVARHLRREFGDLTQEKIKKLEREFWETQMRLQVSADLLSGPMPSPKTAQTVLSGPKDIATQIFKELGKDESREELKHMLLRHRSPIEVDEMYLGATERESIVGVLNELRIDCIGGESPSQQDTPVCASVEDPPS